MAEEPLPAEVLTAFAKALKERNDRELKLIQERHERDIKDLKQIYDDIIKDKLQRSAAAERQTIIKEQALYRDRDIALKNRSLEADIREKRESLPRELEKYVKQYQDAQKILKDMEEQSRADKLKPDQPRR